jgi:hypothetical protein
LDTKEITLRSSAAEYLTFIASEGEREDRVEIRYEEENIWLTQKAMAQLYDVTVAAINQHIKKIFTDKELDKEAVIKKYLITANDGKHYQANHYNLQMIISVGFKVNSERAVQFRKWVNHIAKEYTIKGWVMDDERLNRFIEMFEYGLVKHAGKVTAEIARLHALSEFEKYRVIQDKEYISDFDRFMMESKNE